MNVCVVEYQMGPGRNTHRFCQIQCDLPAVRKLDGRGSKVLVAVEVLNGGEGRAIDQFLDPVTCFAVSGRGRHANVRRGWS